MNLLFSIDQNCSTLLLNCMRSIAKNGGAQFYDAYILHSDLHIDLQNKISLLAPDKFTCHFIEVSDELFAGFPESKRYPKQIYYRLAAAHLLPVHLERVLYLDVDTLVINPLTELYESDFEAHVFMACTHMNKLLARVNQVRLDVEKHVPYINTGVLLMNLSLMRKEVSLQQIQAYAAQKKAILLLPDQDILTALYGNRVKLIDPLKYNLSDRDIMWNNADLTKTDIDLEWVQKNAVILHYYGRNKPWKENYRGILGVFYTEQEDGICAIG